MKTFRSKCELSVVITFAGLLHISGFACGVNEFRRCYNTSVDMHCFDVQFDTTNNQSLTLSFDEAQQRCRDQKADLVTIKNEETDEIFQKFINDTDNPIRLMSVWMDAYRFNDYNNGVYRWQWLNSSLPNLSASDVQNIPDSNWYVAALAYKNERFYLRAQQPHLPNSYICEYEVSNCASINSSSARHFDGRCYAAIYDQISWYDARNRCLKGGGDLASFANVISINFTSWLLSNTSNQYWIGLRFGGYIWKDSGEDVKFAKWIINYDDWDSRCLIVCSSGPKCRPNFSWYPQDCNATNSIHVVCHSATTLHPTTTQTTTTPSAIPTSRSEISQSINNTSPYESSESKRLAIGVGVGVGLGVAILIAVIVIVICVAIRKRRHEPSTDQPIEVPAVNGRGNVGDPTYGIVVPSKSSGPAADASEANSTAEQTVYAPLQIL